MNCFGDFNGTPEEPGEIRIGGARGGKGGFFADLLKKPDIRATLAHSIERLTSLLLLGEGFVGSQLRAAGVWSFVAGEMSGL